MSRLLFTTDSFDKTAFGVMNKTEGNTYGRYQLLSLFGFYAMF